MVSDSDAHPHRSTYVKLQPTTKSTYLQLQHNLPPVVRLGSRTTYKRGRIPRKCTQQQLSSCTLPCCSCTMVCLKLGFAMQPLLHQGLDSVYGGVLSTCESGVRLHLVLLKLGACYRRSDLAADWLIMVHLRVFHFDHHPTELRAQLGFNPVPAAFRPEYFVHLLHGLARQTPIANEICLAKFSRVCRDRRQHHRGVDTAADRSPCWLRRRVGFGASSLHHTRETQPPPGLVF